MTIEIVKLSEKAKTQLITLKRRTGIQNWNVLCRWAFCTSLNESSIPPKEKIQIDSSIEMTWKIFGGTHAEVYFALLVQRCKQDRFDLSSKTLNEQFKLHLHRGISYLATNPKLTSIATLLALTKKPLE
ncbi:DNA sulfur modification protein DndE [Candidatus Parabeggiatoa sp. HSG14]|uniref:DNA sulfur modification protein DndE n=1 Tax=Candidatus Parabeggiatoa sp. HSG14 TaxID=3055593 RepID=UPI0025A745CA|nr:DNA sulfur modification protein DndE [Thiotrichales bacterium HSG14]